MKTIPLSKGYEAIVDDEYYSRIVRFTWHARALGMRHHIYAYNNNRGSLHHYVYEYLSGNDAGTNYIDHINGNTLDNRLENLRSVTPAENSRNRSDSRLSVYTGVTYRKHVDRWVAKTKVDGKFIHLGYFESPEEAGMAYDRATLYYHGDTEILNFPDRKGEHNLSEPYQRNMALPRNKTGYRGVNVLYTKGGAVYTCTVRYGGRASLSLRVGTYSTPEIAAWAYNEALQIVNKYGEFDERMLNEVGEPENVEEIFTGLADRVLDRMLKRGEITEDSHLFDLVYESMMYNPYPELRNLSS